MLKELASMAIVFALVAPVYAQTPEAGSLRRRARP